jgi:glucosamine kinase
VHVNDAVIAHAGALRSEPGIVAISGTGSIVLDITQA